MLQARYYRQRFSRHAHEAYCIGVIEEGAQRFYRSGGEHVAPRGDIILVNADDVHTGCSELENGWAYRAIYPHPNLLQSISRDIRHSDGSVPWFPDAVLQSRLGATASDDVYTAYSARKYAVQRKPADVIINLVNDVSCQNTVAVARTAFCREACVSDQRTDG